MSLTTTHHGWTGPLRSEGPGPGLVSGCSHVAPVASTSSEGGPCDILAPPWPWGGAAALPGPEHAQQLAWMSWRCSPCTMPSSRDHPPPHPSSFPSGLYSISPYTGHQTPCQILAFISYPYLFYFFLTTREMLFLIIPIFSLGNGCSERQSHLPQVMLLIRTES